MAIIEQIVEPGRIYIRTVSGEFEITRAEIKALVQSKGSKAAALADLRQQIKATLGDDVDITKATINFDAQGQPTDVTWVN